jgi:hypothetical protein
LISFVVHLFSFWHNGVPARTVVVPASTILNLELRHHHAVSSAARVVFADAPQAQEYSYSGGRTFHRVRTRPIKTHRPPSFDSFSEARIRSIRHAQSQDLHWNREEVVGPDVESRETLLELAKMTSNAYVKHEDSYWYDLGDRWSEVGSYSNSHWIIQPGSLNIWGNARSYAICGLISLHTGLSVRLGTRRGWFPWLCLCNTRQLHCCYFYQGNICRGIWK